MVDFIRSKICRLCLFESSGYIDISSEEGINKNVLEIIGKHIGFVLAANSYGTGSQICEKCWMKLFSFHEFYLFIESSHNTNLNLFTSYNQNKNSDVPNAFKCESIISGTDIKMDCCIENKYYTAHKLNDKTQNNKQSIDYINPNKMDSAMDLIDSNFVTTRTFIEREQTPQYSIRKIQDKQLEEFFKLDCQICRLQFESFNNVKKHYREMHSIRNGYIMCCNRKYFRRGALIQHMESHTNPTVHICPICNGSYKSKDRLKYHMIIHTPNDKKEFKCNICDKAFAVKHQLAAHLRKTHIPDDSKNYRCPTCNKAFPLNSILQSHIRNIHKAAGRHVCDVCAKIFNSPYTYKQHCLQHLEIQPPKLQCELCGKWVKNKTCLDTHVRRNHRENVQKCEICGKITPNKDALRKHKKQSHHNERPFKCHLCEKLFKSKIAHKEHLATHTGEVLYKCPYCSKTFNSNANLHSHRKKNHYDEWNRDRGKLMKEISESIS